MISKDLLRKHSFLDYYIKQDSWLFGTSEIRHHVGMYFMVRTKILILTSNFLSMIKTIALKCYDKYVLQIQRFYTIRVMTC